MNVLPFLLCPVCIILFTRIAKRLTSANSALDSALTVQFHRQRATSKPVIPLGKTQFVLSRYFRRYRWWGIYAPCIYLLVFQLRPAVGDSGLCCYVHVTSTPFVGPIISGSLIYSDHKRHIIFDEDFFMKLNDPENQNPDRQNS